MNAEVRAKLRELECRLRRVDGLSPKPIPPGDQRFAGLIPLRPYLCPPILHSSDTPGADKGLAGMRSHEDSEEEREPAKAGVHSPGSPLSVEGEGFSTPREYEESPL